MLMRLLVFGWITLFSGVIFSATLNVEFDVRTRAHEGEIASQKKQVAVFVLDRSGSMLWKPANGESAANRNELLRESVRERVRVIGRTAPNTDVYFLQFAGEIAPMAGPFSVNSEAAVKKIVQWEGLNDEACGGLTLLYDAQARALDFIDELLSKDPSAKVQLFVYTDGANETPKRGYWEDESQKADDSWFSSGSRRVKVRYPSVSGTSHWERDMARALTRFKEDYLSRVRSYVASGKMEQYWGWLGAGEPPDDLIKKTKDEYFIGLSSPVPTLKSPAAVPSQTLPATLVVPVPEKYAADLDGLRVTATLEVAGDVVSGKVLSLKPGKKTISFQLKDSAVTDRTTGLLRISDLPDVWDRIALRPPEPLELTFVAADKIPLSIVPSEEQYVRVGDKVDFAAQSADGAAVTWTVSKKTVSGASFSQVFERAGEQLVSAKAEKAGCAPATVSCKVHVLETGLDVCVATASPTVGDPVGFRAQVCGKAERLAWWVDGNAVPGHAADLSGQVFERSGKHCVKARAYYGHGLSADSPEVAFEVAAKPSVVITEPYDGSEFENGANVTCVANVEGAFDKVVWKLSGPMAEEREAPVMKDARVSKPALFRPVKGGTYALTAVAKGPSGELAAKTVVKFKVARADMSIVIDSPASGSVVGLGSGVKETVLKAKVKGDAVKQVKWNVINRKTGKPLALRTPTTPVQGGVATCAFPNDPSIGNGVTLLVRAEAVLPSGEDPLLSETIELVTSLVAELDIEATVDGKEANGGEVRFGEQIVLKANCRGIDAAKVRWLREANGKETEIGTGPGCMAPREEPSGENLRTVRYFARVKLADGSVKTSRKVIVHHHCPDFKAAIKLPKGADGITRMSFGLKDAVHAEIELSEGAELVDVVWEMGDGTTYKGMVASHPHYAKYGEYTITASGKCKNCGKPYKLNPVKVTVEKQRPKAAFVIEEKGTYHTVGGKLHLRSTSTGDVCSLKWTVDGVELTEFADKSEAVVKLPGKPGELNVALTATGLNGADLSVAEREVRVRFGWLAIVVLALLALLLIGILKWLFLGNGPAGWWINLRVGFRPDTSSDKQMKLFSSQFVRGYKAGVIGHFWRFWGLGEKYALIPIRQLATYRKSRSAALKAFAKDCNPQAAIKIGLAGNKPYIKGSKFASENVGIDSVQGNRFQAFPQSNEREGQPLRYLFVALDTTHAAYGYVACFVVLTLGVIAGCAWAMMKYAI